MKALEKAAKTREEAAHEHEQLPPRQGAGASPELTLEPIAESRPADAPSPRLDQAARAAQPTQAAAMLSASSRRRSGFGDVMRDNPVIVIGALAALFAIGFGLYVYQQIFHPGLFLRGPAAVSPAPLVRSPPADFPAAAIQPVQRAPAPGQLQSGTVPAAPAAPPLAVASPAAPSPSTAVAVAPPSARSALPENRTETPGAIPRADTPMPAGKTATARSQRQPARRGETGTATSTAVAAGDIAVTPEIRAAPPDQTLMGAYHSFEEGRFDEAKTGYERLLQSDPRNVDALLGLGAIAAKGKNTDAASRYYLRVLDLDPANSYAQGGLIGLLGRADPSGAETRLKQLITRAPAPFLYFTLGNVYAEQSQWASAQSAYFQAHNLQPDNPDYAFNLAIGLEHLSQPKLALGFYRRALQLAQDKGRASFDTALAQTRIRKLEAATRE